MDEGVPLRVLQFWHEPDTLPDLFKQSLQQQQQRNPDLPQTLFDDKAVCALLQAHYPALYSDWYRRIRIPAVRSDVARYVLLDQYGGLYLDVSMDFKLPLTTLFDFSREGLLVRRDDISRYRDCPQQAHFLPGIIGLPAGSVLAKACMEQMFQHLQTGCYNTNVSAATGPLLFNQQQARYYSLENSGIYSFKALLFDKKLRYQRLPGVSNRWLEQQKLGIIDPIFYAGGTSTMEVDA